MEAWRQELYHYGIKGMRWGVRRTPEQLGHKPTGKKHGRSLSDTQKKVLKVGAGMAVGALAGYGAYRLKKSGAISTVASSIRRNSEDYFKSRQEAKAQRNSDRKVKAERRKAANRRRTMSSDEIKERIERIRLEKQFKDLVDEDTAPGRKFVLDLLAGSGKKAFGIMTTGAMVYAVKVALTQKADPKEAAGYIAPKPKNK